MITRPTVFIVGAGGSKPYGYPLGGELVKKIIIESLDSNETTALIENGYTLSDYSDLRDNLKFAGAPSIDLFLEHRPELREIGKLVIAMKLMKHESLQTLFNRPAGCWYSGLFNSLITKPERFGDNNVSFVTFNYDRSLETYLHTALKYSYNWTDERAAEQVRKIPFVHVYGKLSRLPWQEHDGTGARAYGSGLGPVDTKQAASGVKIISESESDTAELQLARNLILEAQENVYFLGFGFNWTNVTRLGLPNKDGVYHATGSGLTAPQRKHLSSRMGRNFEISECTCEEFLRMDSRFLVISSDD